MGSTRRADDLDRPLDERFELLFSLEEYSEEGGCG